VFYTVMLYICVPLFKLQLKMFCGNNSEVESFSFTLYNVKFHQLATLITLLLPKETYSTWLYAHSGTMGAV
jgi:hypothetical protein